LLLSGAAEVHGQPAEVSPGLRIDFVVLDSRKVVSATQEIVFEAAIINDPSSTQTLFGDTLTGSGFEFGSMFYEGMHAPDNPYIWTSGFDGVPFPFEQLRHAVVPPGGSFRFEFGVAAPRDGVVAPGNYTSALSLGYLSCCQFSRPISVTVSATCDPPQSMELDVLNALPLANATISSVRVEGCLAVVDLRIENYLSVWLGLDGVSGPPDSLFGPIFAPHVLDSELAANGLVTPCGGLFAGLLPNASGDPTLCASPGMASWTVKFASAGQMEYALSVSPAGATWTLADLFLSVFKPKGSKTGDFTFRQLLQVAEAFTQMPSFQQAVQCVSDEAPDALAISGCLDKAVLHLITEVTQLKETMTVLGNAIGRLSLGQMVNAFAAVSLRAEEIGTALMPYFFYTGNFSDQPGVISIKIAAH
jgi:hypothetical protein